MPTIALTTSWSVVAGDVADELDIDLEVPGGDVLQIGERSEAGPEIVKRYGAAEVAEPRREQPRGGEVGHRRGFGDLEVDLVGLQSASDRLAVRPR